MKPLLRLATVRGCGLLVATLFCGCAAAPSPCIATRVVTPVYPPIALSAAVVGDVDIRVTLDRSGAVRSAEVVEGHLLLKQAAAAAAREWSFTPGADGREVTLTFAFQLDQRTPGKPRMASMFLPPYRLEVIDKLPASGVNYR